MSKFEEVKGDLQQTVDRLPFDKAIEVYNELGEAITQLTTTLQGTKSNTGKEFREALGELPGIVARLQTAEALIGELAVEMGGAITTQIPRATQFSVPTDMDLMQRMRTIETVKKAGYPNPALLRERTKVKTLEEETTIQAVNATTNSYLEERLGVNLEDRTPPLERFHIVNSHSIKELSEALKAPDVGLDDKGNYAAFNIFNDTIIPEGAHASSIQHEGLHYRCYQRFKKEEDGTYSPISHGVKDVATDDFTLLGEAITEKTNQEIIKQRWSEHPHLHDVPLQKPGYGLLVPYFDAVCQVIAERTGQTEDDVLRGFQRAEFLGDMRIFNTIEDTMGYEVIERLASLRFKKTEKSWEIS